MEINYIFFLALQQSIVTFGCLSEQTTFIDFFNLLSDGIGSVDWMRVFFYGKLLRKENGKFAVTRRRTNQFLLYFPLDIKSREGVTCERVTVIDFLDYRVDA